MMRKIFFMTAIRTVAKNRNYTLLNVLGLTIGIAVALVIMMIIHYETNFDNFHKNKERIYRILTTSTDENHQLAVSSLVPAPLPGSLKNDFPNIEVTDINGYPSKPVAIVGQGGGIVKSFNSDLFFTDPSFFKIFDFKWIAGNPNVALNDPNTAVLTKKIASLFFGKWQDALGKTIIVNRDFTLKVGGILDDIPAQTDFQFKVILPVQLLKHTKSDDWSSLSGYQQCYVMLPPSMNSGVFEQQLVGFSKKYRGTMDRTTHSVQRLDKVHYDSKDEYEGVTNFSGKFINGKKVMLLILIAVFILVIACVNFINLATAQAVTRAKEVGIRKTIGGSRAQLTNQFLTETALLVLAAILCALGIVFIAGHSIGNLIDMPIALTNFPIDILLPALIGILFSITLLAGLYPGLILSSFKPIEALKGKTGLKSSQKINLRPLLIIVQFIVTQILIIAAIVIVKQLNFLQEGKMGFEKNSVINISFKPDSLNLSKLEYLRTTFLKHNNIENVSFSNTTPAEEDSWWQPIKFDNADRNTSFSVISKFIDTSYVDTYKLSIIAGRNIRAAGIRTEYLINETLAKKLGYKQYDDILNKEISFFDSNEGTIVGVVKDFHTGSFKSEIAPIFLCNTGAYGVASIRLAGDNPQRTISNISEIWKNIYPDSPFEYKFMDEKINELYRQEHLLSTLYQIFSGIAIFLSCLGLYAIVAFTTKQRIKEIGIRKVLGASSANIVYMFSKNFIPLVLISFLIASPIVFYFIKQWLEGFAYHISIDVWIFVSAGAGTLTIALITISIKALEASYINPVKNLKA